MVCRRACSGLAAGTAGGRAQPVGGDGAAHAADYRVLFHLVTDRPRGQCGGHSVGGAGADADGHRGDAAGAVVAVAGRLDTETAAGAAGLADADAADTGCAADGQYPAAAARCRRAGMCAAGGRADTGAARLASCAAGPVVSAADGAGAGAAGAGRCAGRHGTRHRSGQHGADRTGRTATAVRYGAFPHGRPQCTGRDAAALAAWARAPGHRRSGGVASGCPPCRRHPCCHGPAAAALVDDVNESTSARTGGGVCRLRALSGRADGPVGTGRHRGAQPRAPGWHGERGEAGSSELRDSRAQPGRFGAVAR